MGCPAAKTVFVTPIAMAINNEPRNAYVGNHEKQARFANAAQIHNA